MEELMLKIDNVKKVYRLGQIGGTTLRDELQRKWAKIRKKEDPTKVIGSKNYNNGEKFMALDGVSFEVKKGERVGIIGHNGAGKSTLLKLISRITAPTDGSICLNGRVSSMLEVGTGFHGELTGRENVYMNGAILGMTKNEIDKKMDDIIEFSEVRKFIDTPVKRYSSGMYVKLAFAVAAHLDSEILIMDEVLAVGDMAFQKKCLDKMNQVSHDEGRTILYVSHNMSTIRQLCNRVIVLNHGKIIFDGDVEEGIGVYLGKSALDKPVKYDLDNVSRPSHFHGSKLHITNFVFLEKDSAVFDRNEQVKFSFDFNANEDIENIKVYFTVMSLTGTKIGMTQSISPICDVKKGRKYNVQLAFDISNIAAGDYCFYLDVFSEDGTGRHLSYDHPDAQIIFSVIDDYPIGLRWNDKYYGSIMLNELKCISFKEKII